MAFSDNIITATSELSVTDGPGGSVFADVIPSSNKAYILGRLGVGTLNPVNALDVEGGAAVGAGFSGSSAAPSNGLIVQGNVGIGTASPASRLDVSGNIRATSATVNGNVQVTGRIGIGTSPAFPLDVHGRMRVRQMTAEEETSGIWLSGYYRQEFNAAFVGLQTENTVGFANGATPPVWRMTVTLDKGNLTITGNGFKPGGGAWGSTSDERLKQDIRPLTDALEKLLQLKPVVFEWKEPETQGNLTGPQMGFLAQDVESVFPDWVSLDSQGYRVLTIRGFEALVVEALKQLRDENDQLKEAYAQLLERVDALETQDQRARSA